MMRALKDIIENEFYWRRHVWLNRVSIFLNIILIFVVKIYSDLCPQTHLAPLAKWYILCGFSILFLIYLKNRIYNPEQWKDFNLVRHLTRTSIFYFYFSLLLLFIGSCFLEINSFPAIASGIDIDLDFVKKLDELRVWIWGTQEEHNARCELYGSCRTNFFKYLTILAGVLRSLLQYLTPENLQNHTQQANFDAIIKRINIIFICLNRIIYWGSQYPFLYLYTYWRLIFVDFIDSIYVEPVIWFIYKLIYFGDFKSYLFIYLGWYSLIKRDTFIYDKGLSYNYRITIERHKVLRKFHPYTGYSKVTAFVEHLDTTLYQIFDSDGNKWPEKSNTDYTFYDKERRRLTPLDSSKFQLFIGDPQDHRRIDCSQFQIYKNCTKTEDTSKPEYNIYNAYGTPYPFINNTAYTLYNLHNDPLNMKDYHIFDMKGNKLEYSFFCESWEESGIKYRPIWTIDRKEHYIFDNNCNLQNNEEIRIRYYKNKKWEYKDPEE